MKKIIQKWNSISLVLRIAAGLLIGTILALIVPGADAIGIMGDLFVNALKSVAPILVFALVMSSLLNSKQGIGKKLSSVVFYYMLSTLLAAIFAVCASFIFPVTIKLAEAASGDAPSGLSEILSNLLMNIIQNPVAALMNGNYIGILAWAILLGLTLKNIASSATKDFLSNFSDAMSAIVKGVISFAPFGIAGIVFKTISTNGLSVFVDYGKLLALLVGCMLIVFFGLNSIIVGISLKRNPFPLVWRCFKESGITAFFTRSSAANIPVNMALCEKLGLDKDMYSVSIPLGATINMDGAAVTITIMTMATAYTMGIAVDFPSAILLSIIAALGACGTSGVAGGSILLIPMACSLFGISADVAMQVVAVGFILGVIQDSLETAINSAGDVLFAATAEYRSWIKEGKKLPF